MLVYGDVVNENGLPLVGTWTVPAGRDGPRLRAAQAAEAWDHSSSELTTAGQEEEYVCLVFII